MIDTKSVYMLNMGDPIFSLSQLMKFILTQIIPQEKTLIKPIPMVLFFTLLVFSLTFFFAQMQEEPKTIITSPPIVPNEPEFDDRDFNFGITARDEASITDSASLILTRQNGQIEMQKTLDGGLIEMTLKIPHGATWVYTIQI